MTYCRDCQTELPEGAHFCFRCGKAVFRIESQARPRISGTKAEPNSGREYSAGNGHLRVAPRLVTISPEIAALVLYGNASIQGECISLKLQSTIRDQDICIRELSFEASVTPREVDGQIYYVALFPRIPFGNLEKFKLWGGKGITHVGCRLEGLPVWLGQRFTHKFEYATLYPGLITEVDWSRVIYNRELDPYRGGG